MTNFEKIKAMSLEEMAAFIAELPGCTNEAVPCYGRLCHECFCEWLQKEAE